MGHPVTAFVFPAFEMKYASYDVRFVEGFEERLAKALEILGDRCTLTVQSVVEAYASADHYVRLSDDQKHQLCNVSSALLVDHLEERGVTAQWVAPYSMGLFASLYAVRCLSFEEGFAMMNHVCRTAHEVGRHRQGYGMASVVGLSRHRMENLIRLYGPETAVSDEMSEMVIIVSGKKDQLETIVTKALTDGAFHAKLLAVELPYHSAMMSEAEERIEAFAATLSWKPPRVPVVACTDQKILRTVDEVRREVCTNVLRPLHWRATVALLLEKGVTRFVECGFCESLSKMLKMNDKSIQVFHPKRFNRLDHPEPMNHPPSPLVTLDSSLSDSASRPSTLEVGSSATLL